MDSRIVVTRIDGDGKSTYEEHGAQPIVQPVDPTRPLMQAGKSYTLLWGTAGPEGPTIGPGVDETPSLTPFFADPGGTRFVLFTLPPEGSPVEENANEQEVPGLVEYFSDDASGMHASDTLDYVCVLHGSITLELDDGATVDLNVGDCLVQRGTRHAWRNRSATPATLVAFIAGAKRLEPDA